MAVVIEESGMQFGEYTEEQVFHLEKSILLYDVVVKQSFLLGAEHPEYIVHDENIMVKFTALESEKVTEKVTERVTEKVIKGDGSSAGSTRGY